MIDLGCKVVMTLYFFCFISPCYHPLCDCQKERESIDYKMYARRRSWNDFWKPNAVIGWEIILHWCLTLILTKSFFFWPTRTDVGERGELWRKAICLEHEGHLSTNEIPSTSAMDHIINWCADVWTPRFGP